VGSQAGVAEYEWPHLNPLRTITSDVENIHAVHFSASGQLLAVAGGAPSESGRVEIYNWPECNRLQELTEPSDSVMAIAWIDDSTLATASLDQDVLVSDVETGVSSRRLVGHSKGVTALCFAHEDDLLVSAGIDQNLRVWNLASGELVRSLNNHTRPVHSLALRPGNHSLAMIVSASDDKTVRLWQPAIGRMVRFVRLDSVPLDGEWLSDGTRIVVSCADGYVRAIDPDRATVVEELPAINGWAYCLAAHPRDGSLVVGGSDGQLKRITLPAEP
jgi:WD40 repeat protein